LTHRLELLQFPSRGSDIRTNPEPGLHAIGMRSCRLVRRGRLRSNNRLRERRRDLMGTQDKLRLSGPIPEETHRENVQIR
jgi:hypothetical protein